MGNGEYNGSCFLNLYLLVEFYFLPTPLVRGRRDYFVGNYIIIRPFILGFSYPGNAVSDLSKPSSVLKQISRYLSYTQL